MSWFKNPLDFAEGLLDQVDKRVSSVVGPSSNEDESERPRPPALPPAPPKNVRANQQSNVIEKPEVKRSTPTTSPQRSPAPAPARSGTLKLPRKLPPRTSPSTTTDTVSLDGSGSGAKLAEASSLDASSKPATAAAEPKLESSAPRTLPRPSPPPNVDRSLPAPAAASDLASSPPLASNSPTKRLPVNKRTSEPPASNKPPKESHDESVLSEEGAGWLATARKQPETAVSSPKSAGESSPSPAALQPPSNAIPESDPTLASTSALRDSTAEPASSPKVFAKPEPSPAASPARSPVKNASLSALTADAGASKAAYSSNGNGLDSSRLSQDVLSLPVPSQYTAGSPEERESPQADVNLDADSENLLERLKEEQVARKNIAQEVSRLRDELMAAQGRAAVAEAGLAEARDDLATMEDRLAAAEDAAAHADDAISHAKQSADDVAGTAAAATAAAEARAAAAAEAASAARSKAREAMQRADLKADALRSCEARLGQLETELEQASSARDAAVAEAAQLRAEVATTAERAVMQGNEAVDSLQKELNAAREAAAAAQAEAQAERNSAAEARITAERRLADMESALGVAHAEASQSTRAAEEAVEALEAAEAANASLQQRLAESAVGSPKQESSGSFELQARLESSEARCMELEQAARHSQHRVEELELELAEQRTGTARHAMHELQGQLKQANQLLAERQAMWERSAAEHAARSLTLERQLAQAQDKLQAAGRQAHTGGERRASPLSVTGEDVVPMDSLHGYYRFVSHRRFGKAFKAFGGSVDSATAQVVAVLRRNPLARVAMLLYIVFVHLLIYVLIGHMQHHATASIAHAHPGVDVTGTLSRFDTPINKIQTR